MKISYDEFDRELKRLLKNALESGIGVNSIHIDKEEITGRCVMLGLNIDADMRHYKPGVKDDS